jgi:hypothetical protein
MATMDTITENVIGINEITARARRLHDQYAQNE